MSAAWTRRRPWNEYGAVRYSEDQPRDEQGRFGSGGGDSANSGAASPHGISTQLLSDVPGMRGATLMGDQFTSSAGGAAYAAAMQDWSSDDKVSAELREAVTSGHPTSESAQVLQEALDRAPTIDEAGYRGIGANAEADILSQTGREDVEHLQVGDTFNINPSSFSLAENATERFSPNLQSQMLPPAAGSDTKTYITSRDTIALEPGYRAAPVMGLSSHPEEEEIITGGKFEVTAPTTVVSRDLADPMFKHEVITRTVNVRQAA